MLNKLIRIEMAQKSPATQAQLSKNVLQMKFMQRSVLRIEREKNEEEQQKIIDDEHWVIDLPQYKTKESKFQKDLGYLFCEELEVGRQSYKGFNLEIEKLMKNQKVEKELTESEEREKLNSVDDEEMAHRYTTLMGVIAKKFAKKRHQGKMEVEEKEEETNIDEVPAAKKFKKPRDD